MKGENSAMSKVWKNSALMTSMTLIVLVLGGKITLAQDDHSIQRAQQAIRDRILSDEGRFRNRDQDVHFNNDARTQFISNAETRVTGSGVFVRTNEGRSRDFFYEATINVRNGIVKRARYNWRGGWYSGDNGGYWENRPNDNSGSWNDRPRGRMRYQGPIMNENSRKVLDVAGRNQSDGANVQQWDWARQANQEWEIIDVGRSEYAIINRSSGRALDVADNRLYDNGANVQQYRWSGRANQRWRLEGAGRGTYRIVNSASGKCLDVVEQSHDNGASIHQWNCGGHSSQRWRLDRY